MAFLLDSTFKPPTPAAPNGMAFVTLPDVLAWANADFFTTSRIRAATARTSWPLEKARYNSQAISPVLDDEASSDGSVTAITFMLRSGFNGVIKLVKDVAPDTANFVH